MTAAELYQAMRAYLTERGWHREAPGSRWWEHEDFTGTMLIGEAVGEQLLDEGVNLCRDPGRSFAGLRSLTPDDFGHSVRVDAEQLARTEFGGES